MRTIFLLIAIAACHHPGKYNVTDAMPRHKAETPANYEYSTSHVPDRREGYIYVPFSAPGHPDWKVGDTVDQFWFDSSKPHYIITSITITKPKQ
jgi:hypothetical protein